MKKIIQPLVGLILLLLLSPSLAYDDDDDNDEGSNKHKKWWSTPLIVVLYMGFFLLAAMVSLCIRHFRERANVRNHLHREGERGLDEEEIESLPSLRYSEMKLIKGVEKGKDEQLECAICLAEFNDQEVVRVLPDCYHVFHPSCIAPWLASHVTCPICRSSLEHKQGSSASMSTILDGTSGPQSQRFDPNGSQQDHDHDHDHDHVTVEIGENEPSSTSHSEENNLNDHADGPGVTTMIGTRKLPRPYSTGDITVQLVENCTRSTSLSSLMPKQSSPKSDYLTTNVNNLSCISSKSDRFVDYSSLVLVQLKSNVVESASHETYSSLEP